ncbi:MAG TPA: Wzz/FepE/Etk N-terminal domain-containing protein [Gaiellales bacterium]|jgi:capsular polysaccharide biosynthesis protein
MSSVPSRAELPSLEDYLLVLRRRAAVIVATVVLLAVVAFGYAEARTTKYQASAQVLLEQNGIGNQLAGLTNTGNNDQPDRYAVTQARLARVRQVAVAAAAKVHGESASALLDATSVSAASDADILTFEARDSSAERARSLANAYARAFTRYRSQLDAHVLSTLTASVNARLKRLTAQGLTGSALMATLTDQQQKLQALQTLQTPSVQLVGSASPGVTVSPRPAKYGAIGAGIGILLGIVLAFLFDALDSRLRTARGIAEALDVPLLATLPRAPRRFRGDAATAALDRPGGPFADAYRRLHVRLDVIARDQPTRVILLAGADKGSDAAGVVMNLGVALARAGRRVAILDLDVRRNSTSPLMAFPRDERLQEPPLASFAARVPGLATGDDSEDPCLHVMALEEAGSSNDYVVEHAVPLALQSLRTRYDSVLVVAASILLYSDALAIARDVDGIVVVTRANSLRREPAESLRSLLAAHSTAKLGTVVYEGRAPTGGGPAERPPAPAKGASRKSRAPASQ